MTKTIIKRFVMVVFGLIFFISCQQDNLYNVPDEKVSDGLNSFLGKKLENPYSVPNMRKAFNSLKEKNQKNGLDINANVDDVKVTDLYVKFFIENADQLEKLEADSLNFSILPLDYEIVKEGDLEIDENTLKEEGYWLYTSVPVSYKMPTDTRFEIIEELFLPELEDDEEDGIFERKNNSLSSKFTASFLEELEDESLRLTGNLEQSEVQGSDIQMRRSKRRPQGHIRVQNTTTGAIDPVIGVKVKTRRWFKWGKGYTDNNGFYSVDNTFRRDVNYEVVFKNSRGFKIWPSIISVTSGRYSGGKHSSAGHSITFFTNSKGWRFSTVNNATVNYFNYCNQFGVGTPHSNLRIVAQDATGSSSAPMLRRVWGLIGFTTNSQLVTFLSKANGLTITANKIWILAKLILPDVIIKAAPSQGTARVFEVTFHELAHASHFKQVGSGYWIKYINYIITYGAYGDGHGMNNGVVAVGEMWGYYYGYFLTLQHFGNNNNNPIIRPVALEDFTPVNRPNNSDIVRNRVNGVIINMEGWIPVGIVHDLIDNNADVVRPGFTDNVNGYTVEQIFGALRPGVETVQGFRNRLLQNNGNNQQQAVNDLFNAYFYN